MFWFEATLKLFSEGCKIVIILAHLIQGISGISKNLVLIQTQFVLI
jgi:hypothetical protein